MIFNLLTMFVGRWVFENKSQYYSKTKKPPKWLWDKDLGSDCTAQFDVSLCVVRTYGQSSFWHGICICKKN